MQPEFLGVLVERFNLNTAFFVFDDAFQTLQRGWYVVVRNRDGLFRCANLAVRHTQTFERLRAGYFVNQMAVDIQQTGAVFAFVGYVCIPDFIIE